MGVGAKIRQLREDREWSQTKLAMRSGVTRSYISLMELRDDTHPRTDVLMKLAGAFEVPLEEFYGAAGYVKEVDNLCLRDDTPQQIIERIKHELLKLERLIIAGGDDTPEKSNND